MDMGDQIQRAWRSFVRSNVDAKGLRQVIDEIAWPELSDMDALYFYATIGKADGEPYVASFDGPMSPDYFQGAGSSKLVVAIPVFEGMTKQDLLVFDAAGDSQFWEDPEWADG